MEKTMQGVQGSGFPLEQVVRDDLPEQVRI